MSKTALLIVDMLHDFVHPEGAVFYPENQAIVPAVQTILKACREAGCLIVFMQQRYRAGKLEKNLKAMRPCCLEGSGGENIIDDLPVQDSDYVIPKRRYSSFYGTDLDLVLREHGVERVIIVGTKTNNCIVATAFDAHYRDYETVIIKECVATRDDATQAIYLHDIDRYLGQVMGLEDALLALKRGDWS